MARKHVTDAEDKLLRELRSWSDGSLTEERAAEILASVKAGRGIEDVATYSLDGKTPKEYMRENFGNPTSPEDEPDGEPAQQILIEFED